MATPPVTLGFVELAREYLKEGARLRDVADRLGVSVTTVRKQADHWGLPKKQHRLGGDSSEEWNPTPEEIEEACVEIREGWSDDEWERRSQHSAKMVASLIGR